MATQNSAIAGLQVVVGQIQKDGSAFLSDFATFSAAVKAFLASVSSGATGTVLSAADASAVADMTNVLENLDAAAVAQDAALKAIQIPVAAPPAS